VSSDDLCRCPVDGCRNRTVPYRELYDHLTRYPHRLDSDEANAITGDWFKRMQHTKLRDGRRRMWDWTLDTFPAGDLAGRRALTAARTWLVGDRPWGSSPRVYVYGAPGTGKTGLAYAMARQWIDTAGVSNDLSGEIEFENVRALLAEQRAGFARGEPNTLEHLLDCDYDTLVVLDDLGAERPTEYALETIALIVEHLHAIDGFLIVTTNYPPSELARRLGHADLVVGQRIVSRLVEDALRIELNRPDLRMRGKSQTDPFGTNAADAAAERTER
jgi:IstB-like ATP binding protein